MDVSAKAASKFGPDTKCARTIGLRIVLAVFVLVLQPWQSAIPANVMEPDQTSETVVFRDLPGWEADDHAAAFATFRRSCEKMDAVATVRAGKGVPLEAELAPFIDVCREALARPASLDGNEARTFFERHFVPRRVGDDGSHGFLTGYFEPELEGARVSNDQFDIPVHAKPDDLVQLYPDAHRAAHNHELSAGRNTPEGVVPYSTRQEIEEGALADRGLELLYLADRFDAYIMHVQGSGRVVLPDGSAVRLAYAAKNGHPYTSIGRILIDRGEISNDEMSLGALETWVRRNPEAAKPLMWRNRSYIFFRELEGLDPEFGPLGAQGVSLTPGRSLAVDGSIHALGTPIWVDAPTLDAGDGKGFRRLMVAQDVGSAIKGHERGDIFWGSGETARQIAGTTRHEGRFWVLVPRVTAAGK